MLYAIPATVVLAAALTAAWRHYRALRRDLIAIRVTARLAQAALVRDITALEQQHTAAVRRRAAEEAVFAEARAVVAAVDTAGPRTDLPRGGTDG